MSRDKMGAMVASFPQLLSLSVDDNLRPTVRYLQDEVGVSRDKLGGMVAQFPQLLAYSVDDNLRPTVRYLRDEVGLSEEEYAKRRSITRV